MACVKIEIHEKDLKELVAKHLLDKIGLVIAPEDMVFEVKTSKNYRTAEWEQGQFRMMAERKV